MRACHKMCQERYHTMHNGMVCMSAALGSCMVHRSRLDDNRHVNHRNLGFKIIRCYFVVLFATAPLKYGVKEFAQNCILSKCLL